MNRSMSNASRLAVRTLALAGAVLVPAFASPAAAQVPAELEPAWDALVAAHRAALDSTGIVGATLALVKDGEIAAVDYHGFADRATRRPVDERTIYHWASITKTYTGVAIMQLRDRGRLDLDDPVVEYVPELRQAHSPYGSIDEVTLRHLMSHSSGFRNPTWPWDEGEAWQPFEPTEWSQLVAMMPYTRLHFEPGSRYGYSNPGVIFLGRTLEAVTGDVYEAYIDKNLLDPLGMASAYFDGTPWRLLPHRSNSYRVIGGEPVVRGLEFNTGITVSNGGLNATVPDMAKWVGFVAGAVVGDRAAGRRPAAYVTVLARTSLEEMWTPGVPVDDQDSAVGAVRMGLSFFLYDAGGRRVVGHTGSQHSFRSFILVDPGSDFGLIGAWNTADGDATAPDTDALRSAVMARALAELFPAAPTRPDRSTAP